MSSLRSHSRFRPNKKNKRAPVIVLLVGLMVLVYFVLVGSATTTPGDALARAKMALETRQLETARSLLRLPLGDERLAPWAYLLTGKLAELEGKNSVAVTQYGKITESSAAFLDAQLGLLRLGGQPDSISVSELFADLEQKVSRAQRSDLREELLVTKGMLLSRGADDAGAVSAFNELRRVAPTSKFAPIVQQALTQIYSRTPALAPLGSASNAVAESALLLSEEKPDDALDLLQKAQAAVAEKSPEYFSIRLAQERVMRKLKRNEEADHVLLVLSADGGPGIADEALFRVAKNHWNVNDQGQALTFLDSLQTRFPESPLADEALYTKGRILEEIDELADARDAYSALIAHTRNQLLKVRAWGRTAWLYLRSDNFAYAAQEFDGMRLAAADALRALSQPSSGAPGANLPNLPPPAPNGSAQATNNSVSERDLKAEYLHAVFWEAYSLHRADKAQIASLPYKAPSLEDLRVILATAGSYGYYGQLAQSQLKMTVVNSGAPTADAALCVNQVSGALPGLLEALSAAGLREFGDHEINWQFYRSGAMPASLRELSEDELRQTFTRASLLNRFGQPQTAVGLAEALLRSEQSSALFSQCRNFVRDIAFPLPYRAEFEAASRSSGVALPLLYAIARTESYFNPRAVSRTGAQGLTQLMPSTAKQEGITETQDIFDPAVNLALGAKHLRRLLGEQDQNETYAVAAYNAGSAPVNRWKTRYEGMDPLLWTEMIGYSETKDYVKKVSTAELIYEELLKKSRTTNATPQ